MSNEDAAQALEENVAMLIRSPAANWLSANQKNSVGSRFFLKRTSSTA